jgi:GNAT superfamily N-acetyltransferase
VNTAETLELSCSQAWPPLVTETLGQWRLRWADGFTGRANSVLAVGHPGVSLPEALRRACDFAHSRGIQPLLHAVLGSATENELPAAGWTPHVDHPSGHEVGVLVGPLEHAVGTGVPRAEILAEPMSGWWELTASGPEPSAVERHVLGGAGAVPVGYGIVRVDDTIAGAVRGAVVDDVLLVARLAVRPEFRGRGLATSLMAAIGTWGREHGAARCALQVSERNRAALALYERLGCVEHHRYRYWVPAAGTCEDRMP